MSGVEPRDGEGMGAGHLAEGRGRCFVGIGGGYKKFYGWLNHYFRWARGFEPKDGVGRGRGICGRA